MFVDSKQTPTEEQINILSYYLNKNSLLYDMKSIYIGMLRWWNVSVSSINKRLWSICSKYNIAYKWVNSLAELKNLNLSIIDSLDKNYLLPPKYFNNLYVISSWIDYILSISPKQDMTNEEADQSWNDFVSNLPGKLQFK
jgi:hypothetical protein